MRRGRGEGHQDQRAPCGITNGPGCCTPLVLLLVNAQAARAVGVNVDELVCPVVQDAVLAGLSSAPVNRPGMSGDLAV